MLAGPVYNRSSTPEAAAAIATKRRKTDDEIIREIYLAAYAGCRTGRD